MPNAPASGYYGDAYRRMREFVKTATPNKVPHFGAADILAIADTAEVCALSVDTAIATPHIDDDALERLGQAVVDIERSDLCGFVFLCLQTSCGIAYRAGVSPYIASASKAPLAYYVLQRNEQAGHETSDYEREQIRAAIESSSNGDFESLDAAYTGADYIEWLASYGIDYDASLGAYLHASARSLAAIWHDIHAYLQAGTEAARWFGERLMNTNSSFIRDGVAETGAAIWNKGGWITGGLNSTTDAGIIELDGRVYLMAIATGQPDSGDARTRVADLARQLFAQRDLLA